MIIARHKTITSLGDEQHHELVIDWFDRDWKILITENVKRSKHLHSYGIIIHGGRLLARVMKNL